MSVINFFKRIFHKKDKEITQKKKRESKEIERHFVVKTKKGDFKIISKTFKGTMSLILTNTNLFVMRLEMKGDNVLWICDSKVDAEILITREIREKNYQN